ncbi:hypothetical protein [Clostridium beijerinckii]|jgi:hypothetical protein|uniref:Uncharacterized protein n=2 Tax=Clostridium beijerinckii TaxID=1520 RepID=A0A1S8QPZ2_CLOBE|nr:hypothetical protein [Clostridium beijerinckii]ABR33250.1 hypothetical protein Cbei_1066 [Clostridium beijerinckii NCIMB 8052]AIU04837.1 hypothetical protein Cbs_1066 [Clostridium beijerinckii ATCC 35702]MBF7811851.1 hypothetical protein [Clostridium beijerinckii]NOW92936.1 hypothetical protein [Clostridium beijerinckii]NRT25502.1 hypothetical protein [Clostridium beijerinckii]
MTRKLIIATVLMLSTVMVSCSTKPSDSPKPSDNNTTTVEQNKDDNGSSNADSKKANETTSDTKKVNKVKLSIYSIDDNSLEPNESGTIEVNENSALQDKLKELAKAVSEKKFDNLPIEVKSIDTVNGKKVATINLTDSNNKKWVPKFQGSTGGSVTANTLIENFLQSNNKSKGEWIDGVKFLYNNETIEYEHASDLSTVKYAN